jgi:hypothetical protein
MATAERPFGQMKTRQVDVSLLRVNGPSYVSPGQRLRSGGIEETARKGRPKKLPLGSPPFQSFMVR